MAESLPGCQDGETYREIGGWLGPKGEWVSFTSAPMKTFRFDRWALVHCPSGRAVAATGFPPVGQPSDNPNDPPDPARVAGAATWNAIGAVLTSQRVEGRPRDVTQSIAAELVAKGVAAKAGRIARGSCVCDPAWNN